MQREPPGVELDTSPDEPHRAAKECEQRRLHGPEHPVRRGQRRTVQRTVPRIETLRGEDGSRRADELHEDDRQDERDEGAVTRQSAESCKAGGNEP